MQTTGNIALGCARDAEFIVAKTTDAIRHRVIVYIQYGRYQWFFVYNYVVTFARTSPGRQATVSNRSKLYSDTLVKLENRVCRNGVSAYSIC